MILGPEVPWVLDTHNINVQGIIPIFLIVQVLDLLLKVLHDNAYRGWLVVEAEQDPVVAPSYEYADNGYRHLRALIGGLT